MLTSCTLASRTSSSRPGANRGQASPVKAKVVRTELDRPSLPAHLPRQNVRFDVEGQACPCSGGALHLIVRRSARGSTMFRRGSASSASADRTIRQASAPEWPIAKGFATPALLAHVLVSTITPLFAGKARSSPGRASRSIGPPWRTGSAVLAGGWSHCSKGPPTTSSHHKSYCRLPTTPRSRCWILTGAALRSAGSGSTPGPWQDLDQAQRR
jgi:hypothetical protein